MNTVPTPHCITPDGRGSRLVVQVVPRTSKSEIVGIQGDALKVRLQAPPVDGKANKALCEFIADQLGVSTRLVQLATGSTSRHKTLLLPETPPDVVRERLGISP